MTDKQFEQIEYLSKKLWGDINNGSDYSMVTYTEFLGIVTEVWERLQEEPVSDNLEEAAAQNANSIHTGWIKAICIENFKAGAKWQKAKDESITKDLGEYISELSKQFPEVSFAKLSRIAVRVAKWQKEKEYTCYEEAFEDGAKWNVENLWKPADGDDLPEINKEVIALIEAFGHYKVIFAHRVDENAEIHTSIDGKPLVLHPKRYNKGGWNIPVVYWLDVELPKEIEL